MQTAKSFLRATKNFANGYTDMQVKVREATSNDPWAPSTRLLNEIASATFNERLFREIVSIIRRRLNDHGKNWRHVYKIGSERIVDYSVRNIQAIKTLREFQYVDGDGRDHGAAVRQKSKELFLLLSDTNQIRAYRNKSPSNAPIGDSSRTTKKNNAPFLHQDMGQRHPSNCNEINGNFNEEEALRMALEESKRTCNNVASNSTELPPTNKLNGALSSSTAATTAIQQQQPLIDLMSDEISEDEEGPPSLTNSHSFDQLGTIFAPSGQLLTNSGFYHPQIAPPSNNHIYNMNFQPPQHQYSSILQSSLSSNYQAATINRNGTFGGQLSNQQSQSSVQSFLSSTNPNDSQLFVAQNQTDQSFSSQFTNQQQPFRDALPTYSSTNPFISGNNEASLQSYHNQPPISRLPVNQPLPLMGAECRQIPEKTLVDLRPSSLLTNPFDASHIINNNSMSNPFVAPSEQFSAQQFDFTRFDSTNTNTNISNTKTLEELQAGRDTALLYGPTHFNSQQINIQQSAPNQQQSAAKKPSSFFF